MVYSSTVLEDRFKELLSVGMMLLRSVVQMRDWIANFVDLMRLLDVVSGFGMVSSFPLPDSISFPTLV